MVRREIQDCCAIVTGASSGIGRAIARQLARQGVDLVITARREERLKELASEIASEGRRAMVVVGDVTEEAVRQQLLAAALQLGGLDILVNNAGVGAIGPFATADQQRLRRIMEVNLFAPAELMRTALPQLKKSQRPFIVNICSVLGHRGVPSKSEYCASKFALHGLSDAVRAELVKEGVPLLLVNPSTTSSEFFDNLIENEGGVWWSHCGAMPPEKVAQKTIRAMRRGKHEIILSPGGNFLVWMDRLAPRLTNWIVAKFG